MTDKPAKRTTKQDTRPARAEDDLAIGKIRNRTIFTGDNLHVLRGMNSDTVDLIYLDPPFNSNKMWSAPIGSEGAVAAFRDTWTLSDVDLAWHDQLRSDHPVLHNIILAAREARGDGTMSYLIYMGMRLLEMRRVLKDTGSIYLHCDQTESHSLKLVLDAIFGKKNFRNELVWCYPPAGRAPRRAFHRKHDIILYYADEHSGVWNPPYGEMTESTKAAYSSVDDKGRRYSKAHGGITYLDDIPGRPVPSWWDDIPSGSHMSKKEKVGYPTQKPLALLERIIKASSDPGDVVLDPFAGCATAAIAAEKLERRWVGIDISEECARQVELRMVDQLGLPASLAIHRVDNPKRTDLGKLPHPRTHLNPLYGEQGGLCKGCGGHFEKHNMDVDHIIPQIKGGTDHVSNLQLLCPACNRLKQDKPMSYLTAKLLSERGITYGGRVTEVVRDTEARQAAKADEVVPAGLKEALTDAGLDTSSAGGLLVELAKALSSRKDTN